MRLIQLNLLLLLTVIHCATASPNKGASSGASADQAKKDKFLKCLRGNCGNKLKACFSEDECKTHFLCSVECSKLRDCFNCGVNLKVRKLFTCAAAGNCFTPKNETCSPEIQPNVYNLNNPSLVEEIANVTWWAVLSTDDKLDGFLRYPCARLDVNGTASQLYFTLSVCLGNITTGECNTSYVGFSGHGNQNGTKWILNTQLYDGPFVMQPTSMDFHVHAIEKGEFVVVTGCRKDAAVRHLSRPTVLSPFRTFDKLLENSKNRQSTENKIRKILAQLGENYDKADEINAIPCKN